MFQIIYDYYLNCIQIINKFMNNVNLCCDSVRTLNAYAHTPFLYKLNQAHIYTLYTICY